MSGRGVLVTGASRGIGRAIATAFAREGDRVAVHYGSGAADAEATLKGLPGDGHLKVGGDIADPDRAAAVVDKAVAVFGTLHVLVNNAAVDFAHPLPGVRGAGKVRGLGINAVADRVVRVVLRT